MLLVVFSLLQAASAEESTTSYCFGSNDVPTTYSFAGECTGSKLRQTMPRTCRDVFPDLAYLDEKCAAAKRQTDYENGRDLEYLLGMSSQDLMLHFDGLGDYNSLTEETVAGKHGLRAETMFMDDVFSNFVEKGGHVFWPTQHQMNTGEIGVTYPRFDCDDAECDDGDCCKAPPIDEILGPSCEINAMMCCYARDRSADNNQGSCREPYDTKCFDEDPADNTDLCHVNFTRAAPSSHLRGGMAYFDGDVEGPTHCHGTAWSDDDLHSSYRYAGTNLFYILFQDHLRDRGYVQNIPGAPMCGCVEKMPTVSRADCTEIVLAETWEFVILDDEFHTLRRTDAHIRFVQCRGINGTRNDLESYYLQDHIAGIGKQHLIRPYLAGTCPV